MKPILVRRYESSDLYPVVSLFTRSVHEVNCRDYNSEQLAAWAPELPDMEAWADRLASGSVFVGEQDGAIVGFARIVLDAAQTAYLDLLFVAAEAQGLGVGCILMEQVTAWTISQGVRTITSDVSITARRFFEQQGFKVIAKQKVRRRQVEFRNFRMERCLSGWTHEG